MKYFLPLFLILSLMSPALLEGQEAKATNVPPDPFGELDTQPEIPGYTIKVDRTRGSFELKAADGTYTPGSHFGNWHWTANFERWGNYYAGLIYESARPKLGVQLKVGEEATLKSYAARTNNLSNEPMILGTAYIPKKGEYPIFLLTGDQSNVPAFDVKGIRFSPAPEGDALGQSIDGTIQLDAKTATTYAEMMRYEPQENKNCLGYWIHEEDWAEWVFDLNEPGKFEVTMKYGCGTGNEGSEVAILVNDQTLKLNVEDTGGFQEWVEVSLGEVDLSTKGKQKLAVVPQKKAGKAVMDIRHIVLTPVK